MAKVLLCDDEMTMVQMVGEILRAEGHMVIPFTSGQIAAEKLPGIQPQLVVASLGSERARPHVWNVLQVARSLTPPALVIVLTAASPGETALEAMKKGAYDCLAKPFSVEELKLRVQRALSYQAALSENLTLRKQLPSNGRFDQIITRSPKMQAILNLVERVADSDSPLLILGPAGSGKQLLARAIHLNSRRHLAPFAALDCAPRPDNLLEIELFGERKGLFHQSESDRPGLFREAEGGTIFLNNVGSLSPDLQVRLVETIQKRRLPATGTDAPVLIDVRLLAGSDESLIPQVSRGAFAKDLFDLLNTSPIVLPSLKERPEDIPLLVSHFLEGRIHARTGEAYAMTADALTICCAHSWPGNIRELQGALQQACLLCQDNTIEVSDLPASVRPPPLAPEPASAPDHRNGRRHELHTPATSLREPGAGLGEHPVPGELQTADLVPLKQFLRDQELNYLHHALDRVGGSKERAAQLLGISLATIYRKLSETVPSSESCEP